VFALLFDFPRLVKIVLAQNGERKRAKETETKTTKPKKRAKAKRNKRERERIERPTDTTWLTSVTVTVCTGSSNARQCVGSVVDGGAGGNCVMSTMRMRRSALCISTIAR
jgi:hypothetical protein